jgi:hypothetical protein
MFRLRSCCVLPHSIASTFFVGFGLQAMSDLFPVDATLALGDNSPHDVSAFFVDTPGSLGRSKVVCVCVVLVGTGMAGGP